MQSRGAISILLLTTLLLWSMTALCAPLPAIHPAHCTRLMYKTMLVEHPAAHRCCPPEKMLVVVCYRMHGGACDTMTRCATPSADDAVVTTAKYHDDGQARSCATAHATTLLIASTHIAGMPWEGAGESPSRTVLDTKADLRI